MVPVLTPVFGTVVGQDSAAHVWERVDGNCHDMLSAWAPAVYPGGEGVGVHPHRPSLQLGISHWRLALSMLATTLNLATLPPNPQ